MRFLVPLIATALAAVGVSSTPVTHNDLNPYSDIWKARTAFNGKLLGALDEQAKGKNVVVSPFGLHSALSSVLTGAEGETFSQLWEVLGYGVTKFDRSAMLQVNQETFKNVSQLQHLGLDFANLLVVDDQLKLEPEFQRAMLNDFRSGILREDFHAHADKATNDINEWVDKITQGKIHKLFDQTLSSDTAAIIANALHLKSTWKNQFQKSKSHVGKFNLQNGSTKNVTYMTIKAPKLKGARYSQNPGFENVQIPIDNEGRLWFGIMLPNPGMKGLAGYTSFTEYIRQTSPAQVDLTLPRFDISQKHSGLKQLFQSLGVKNLFESRAADLSRIDGKRDLFVSDIAHKATVTIDENGVEAAAATGISIEATSAVISRDAHKVVVDRPFIFTISDRVTGIDFFTGLVYEP